MIFGTVFTGQIKTQEKQYIETKVFCFIIPVSVITTMLVTKWVVNGREGIEIKTNRTSIIAAIIRPIVSVLTFFTVGAYIGNWDSMQWLLIPAIFSFVLFVYCWFYFGRTTKYERFVRDQFGKQIGLYLMPEWLKPYELKSKFEGLKKAYIASFGNQDWIEKVKSVPFYNEDFSLAFCLTALENALNNNLETDKLLKELSTQKL